MVKVTIRGVDSLTTQMTKYGTDVAARGRVLTRHYGAILQAQIRARARQQFDVTDYDRTIGMQTRYRAKNVFIVDIGTNEPQGYRLEFGFIGTDTLGRTYHQRPRPHFGPAAQRVELQYRRAMLDLVRSQQ